MNPVSLSSRATVPKHVLVQEIAGQAAILDLQSDLYFGLDDVATDIWRAVTASPTVGQGVQSIAGTYEVEYQRLESDAIELLTKLRDLGLLEVW
jgi:hypothetical protein